MSDHKYLSNQIVKAAESRAKADALENQTGQSAISEFGNINALVIVKHFDNKKLSIKWYLNNKETHRNRIIKLINKLVNNARKN